ncbi:hypothetical protein BDZ94DRAFT_331033 [Collybia nuda]|uniref:Transmembrane protein n=1 Tax=Collybia nuda TaxID=64659 RepID=A0A9P6CC30_9AGAR|nr:hypothetical protein BDZ94DRAFT_331033 [Collybia nuda]
MIKRKARRPQPYTTKHIICFTLGFPKQKAFNLVYPCIPERRIPHHDLDSVTRLICIELCQGHRTWYLLVPLAWITSAIAWSIFLVAKIVTRVDFP